MNKKRGSTTVEPRTIRFDSVTSSVPLRPIIGPRLLLRPNPLGYTGSLRIIPEGRDLG